MAQFPAYWGMSLTPTTRSKPEGPTVPVNITLHANFIVAITGASKGLGRQTALLYAKSGAKGIAIASRMEADLRSLEAEIKNVNAAANVLVQTCDSQNGQDVGTLA